MVQRGLGAALGAAALLVAGVIGEFAVLGQYAGQLRWLEVVLPIGCGLAAIGFFLTDSRRGRTLAASVGVGVLLLGPAIWAVDTLGYQTATTFPAGGPQTLTSTSSTSGPLGGLGFPGGGRGFFGGRGGPGGGAGRGGFPQFGGGGGFGGGDSSLATIVQYVDTHGGGTIAVSSQNTVAPLIISSDAHVAGIGGFTGQESDPSIAWLANEVAAGHIRWVLDDGSGPLGFAGQGGAAPSLFGGGGTGFGAGGAGIGGRPGASAALGAAARACTAVQAGGGTLFDCAGRAAALRALS